MRNVCDLRKLYVLYTIYACMSVLYGDIPRTCAETGSIINCDADSSTKYCRFPASFIVPVSSTFCVLLTWLSDRNESVLKMRSLSVSGRQKSRESSTENQTCFLKKIKIELAKKSQRFLDLSQVIRMWLAWELNDLLMRSKELWWVKGSYVAYS